MFSKILIANRAEIASRVIRTCKRLNVLTVAIFSDADENLPFVHEADEQFHLGGGPLAETYLNQQKIIEAAKQTNCQAIHPGYGFLSENPGFASLCVDHRIIFIGPGPEVIRLMGNKVQAREFAISSGLPVTKGMSGTVEEIVANKSELPFPVLIKAAAGGGGKGMRIVESEAEFDQALESTSREAMTYFGDDHVYVEQFLHNPRHIEVQVLADSHGNAVHLFERECSVQRRYQKVIEEAPSISINDELRKEITGAAIQLVKASKYTNAGTIEFLLDDTGKFYFLEMNTRIQVEHAITEEITGVDIVEQQMRIAYGERMELQQEELKINGHAIEFRIYAEDGENEFLPSPGYVQYLKFPEMDGVRLDTALTGPSMISPDFDPMIAKLIVHSSDRDSAIEKSKSALNSMAIQGIQNNISFLSYFLESDVYIKNRFHTKFLDQQYPELQKDLFKKKDRVRRQMALFASILIFELKVTEETTIWQELGFWRLNGAFEFKIDDTEEHVIILRNSQLGLKFEYEDQETEISDLVLQDGELHFRIEGELYHAYASRDQDQNTLVSLSGFTYSVKRNDNLGQWSFEKKARTSKEAEVKAPMHGKVIEIKVSAGEKIEEGQPLIVLEAMKMENTLSASKQGTIINILVNEGDVVEHNSILLEIE